MSPSEAGSSAERARVRLRGVRLPRDAFADAREVERFERARISEHQRAAIFSRSSVSTSTGLALPLLVFMT